MIGSSPIRVIIIKNASWKVICLTTTRFPVAFLREQSQGLFCFFFTLTTSQIVFPIVSLVYHSVNRIRRQFSSLVKTPQNFNEKTFFIPWNCSYRKPRKKYYGISPRKNLLWSVLSDISQIKNTQDSSNPFLFSPSAKSEPLFWRIYIHSIMFSATHSFPPPPQKKQNKTKKSWNRWHCSLKLGSYFVR